MNEAGTGKITLKEFIDQNHNLLSAMAVLLAIAGFANNLTIHWIGNVLSFLALGATIALWFELNTQFPKRGSFRLYVFREILFVGLIGFIFYFLLAYPTFWNIFLFVPLFVALFFMFIAVLKQFLAIPLIRRIFGRSGERNIFQKILIVVYGFGVFYALTWMLAVSIGASPGFNFLFEMIRANFH